MKIDAKVKRALDEMGSAYEIHKAKDHYFVSVRGYPRIVVAGNHDRTKAQNARHTIASIKRLSRQIMEGDDSGHSND